jgi:hypothetical protein
VSERLKSVFFFLHSYYSFKINNQLIMYMLVRLLSHSFIIIYIYIYVFILFITWNVFLNVILNIGLIQ